MDDVYCIYDSELDSYVTINIGELRWSSTYNSDVCLLNSGSIGIGVPTSSQFDIMVFKFIKGCFMKGSITGVEYSSRLGFVEVCNGVPNFRVVYPFLYGFLW